MVNISSSAREVRNNEIRKLVLLGGHFNITFPFALLKGGVRDVNIQDRAIDDFVAPIIQASEQAFVWKSELKNLSGPVGERVHSMLKKRGSIYELDLVARGIIENNRDFWRGIFWTDDHSRAIARGYVLFVVDDKSMDYLNLFEKSVSVGVVKNLSSALTRPLFERAKKLADLYPDKSIIVLRDQGSVSGFSIFPGANVIEKRIEQVIQSHF